MRRILEESQEPEKMAKTWLAENPEQTAQWLASLAPCEVPLSPRQKKKDLEVPFPFLGGLPKIPLGDWMEKAVKSLSAQFSQNSQKISHGLSAFIGGMIALLSWFHPLFLILIFALIAYIRNRSVLRALAIALSFILIWNLGYWEATLQTLALVFSATVFSVGIGVPLGIWGARHPLFYRGLRLILDFMQTIPSFVYLIPTLMLFGLGVVPGLVSTIIFALPAPIRLTHLGIISVPKELREASTSFGAHPLQTLWKVEIPYALPSLMEGVTQAIMLSLSMGSYCRISRSGRLRNRCRTGFKYR
jgi:ABC-type proline/glycine betaine transport system permease subunit